MASEMDGANTTPFSTESDDTSTAALPAMMANSSPTIPSPSTTLSPAAAITFDFFEKLPGEIQEKVISFVPDVRALIKLRKVSRHLNELVTDKLIDAAIPAYKRQIAGLERLNCWMINYVHRVPNWIVPALSQLQVNQHLIVGQGINIQAPFLLGNNAQGTIIPNFGQTAMQPQVLTFTIVSNNQWTMSLAPPPTNSTSRESSFFDRLPYELKLALGLRTHDHWHPGRLFCFGCCRWKNDDRVDFSRFNSDDAVIMGSKDAIRRRCRVCVDVGGGPYDNY